MSLSRRTFLATGASLAVAAAALPRAAWALSINTGRTGDVTVLSLNGIIALGNGDSAVLQAVSQNVDAGHTKFVLDLGGVRFIDESGAGEIMASHTTVINRGGRLVLANVPAGVADSLTIIRNIIALEVYDSVIQAVMALKP